MSILVLPRNGVFQEPYPPSPFKFEAKSRERYSVRPEKKGTRIYWHMRRQINGILYNLYVAKSGALSHELLENAARYIESQAGVQS